MHSCKDKTFKFSSEYEAKYVRLIQDEACPGDPPCIAIHKIELIGHTSRNIYTEYNMDEEDDVSIIGHISKNRNE